jgi:fermentation-respiration switch protein FrsA (DUF1100 family)
LLHQALFSAMGSEPSLEDARRKASLITDEAEHRGELPAGVSKSSVQGFGTPWFHASLRYEPAPVLQAVRQPILVLNGERDLQVSAQMVLPAMRVALQENARVAVKEMPSLNYLFQTATTGSSAEHGEISETMAPSALDTISSWISATVK